MLLENLSSLDWSHVTHAYGTADDVPSLLRNLTASHEAVNRGALEMLSTTIYHQGTVYQASAYAVPFLLEIVQQEEIQVRDGILRLLTDLAGGNAYLHQHRQYYTEEQKHDPAFQKQLEEEIFWAEATHQAIKEKISLYQEFLVHQERTIRMNACTLLSQFREEAVQLVPCLYKRLPYEKDQCVSACLLYSISVLLKNQSENYPVVFHHLEQCLDEGETTLLRIVAAMGLILTESQTLPAHVLDILLDAIIHPDPVENPYEELPWAHYRLAFDATLSLSHLPSSFTHTLLDSQLIDFVDEVRGTDEQTLLQILPHLLFHLYSTAHPKFL